MDLSALQALKINKFTIFREEATSALAGFYAVPLSSWSNWNLEMLVFVEGRKPEKQRKMLRERQDQQQTQPTRGTRSESSPGHVGVRRALSQPGHPCSLLRGNSVVQEHSVKTWMFIVHTCTMYMQSSTLKTYTVCFNLSTDSI